MSLRGRFLQARWPNQQCQSTEGNQLVVEIRPESHRTTAPCYNNTTVTKRAINSTLLFESAVWYLTYFMFCADLFLLVSYWRTLFVSVDCISLDQNFTKLHSLSVLSGLHSVKVGKDIGDLQVDTSSKFLQFEMTTTQRLQDRKLC